MKLEIIQPQSQIKITTVGIQGPKGEPGDRGFDTGTSGTSGTSGTTGTSGSSGSSGTSGTAGSSGSSGQRGASGSNGTSGTNGSAGSTGSSGTTGTSGTSGISGTNGLNGTDGVDGSSGTSGFSINSGSFATTGSNTFNGNQRITGSLSVSGSISATTFIGSGNQLTGIATKTTGTWTVPAGASVQSFTVDPNSSYTMWVNGNIPNGIITWNATATISNTNVPVLGAQYGWYYEVGNALVLTSMPNQFTGTSGSILTTPGAYIPNTSNVFNFGITNNSGTTQTINYGYIKLS